MPHKTHIKMMPGNRPPGAGPWPTIGSPRAGPGAGPGAREGKPSHLSKSGEMPCPLPRGPKKGGFLKIPGNVKN